MAAAVAQLSRAQLPPAREWPAARAPAPLRASRAPRRLARRGAAPDGREAGGGPPPPEPPRWQLSTAAAAVAGGLMCFALGTGVGVGFLGGLGVLAVSPAEAFAQSPPAAAALSTTGSSAATAGMAPMAAARERGLGAEETAVIELFQRATPSVVNIANLRDVPVRGLGGVDYQRLPVGQGTGARRPVRAARRRCPVRLRRPACGSPTAPL